MADGSCFDLREVPQHDRNNYNRHTRCSHWRISSHGYACLCSRPDMWKTARRSNQRPVPSAAEFKHDTGNGHE